MSMMSMKKYREIKIKDSRLRKIRNEFRKLINLECKKREVEIDNKKWAIGKDSDGKYRPTEEDRKLIGQLNSQYWAIESPRRRSIIRCNICHELESDRIYYPETGEWYCPDCYDKFYVHPEQFVPQG